MEKLETLGKYLMTVMSFGSHDRFLERFQRVECCHAERALEHQRREFRHTVLTSSLSAATGSIARCLRASYAASAEPSFRARAPPAGTPRGSPRCTPTSKHVATCVCLPQRFTLKAPNGSTRYSLDSCALSVEPCVYVSWIY